MRSTQYFPETTMATAQRILHVASTPLPLAGADAEAFASSQADAGADVRLLRFAHPHALDGLGALFVEARLDDLPGGAPARLLRGAMPGTGLPVWLLDCPDLDRDCASGIADERRRGELLCHAAARLAFGSTAVKWRPDAVHCHDRHAGLLRSLLADAATPTFDTRRSPALEKSS